MSRRRIGRTAAVALALVGSALSLGAGVLPAAAQSGAPTLWGIDACNTAQAVVPGTEAAMGNPDFIGRYLGPTPPCSPYPQLTSSEVRYIQSQGIGILLIFDPGRFGAASQQAAQGTGEAQAAIQDARALGAPEGTGIFRDVEKSDTITAAYIESWYRAFQGSGFVPGFYENSYGGPFTCASNAGGSISNLPGGGQPCTTGPGAYCQAYAALPAIATGVALWDNEFEPGYGTGYEPTVTNAPAWGPSAGSTQYPLPCPNTTVAWQYLECGGYSACGTSDPSVDVDEFLSQYQGLLWDGSTYTPVTPFRVCDTRAGTGTPCSGSTIGAGGTLTVQVTGIRGPQGQSVPASAQAVAVNVTAIEGTAGTYLTAYPYGSARPGVSNLNVPARTVQANLAVVPLGSGRISVFNAQGSINVAVDVEGYFAPPAWGSATSGLFHPISPLRICDSRSGTGTACSGTPLGPGSWTKVAVTGCPTGNPSCPASVPGDGTAEAVALNLTAVGGSAGTYLSVTPTSSAGACPSGAPSSSDLNVAGGTVLPNRVIVALGPAQSGGTDQDVCVYNAQGTINAVLDLDGWFGDGGETTQGYFFHAVAPLRLCDTRSGTATECTGQPLSATGNLLVLVAGVDQFPYETSAAPPQAIIANVTAIGGTAGTYLTVYPAAETPMPTASDLNAAPRQVVPNLVIAQLAGSGPDPGAVDIYNAAGTIDVAVDIQGYFQ